MWFRRRTHKAPFEAEIEFVEGDERKQRRRNLTPRIDTVNCRSMNFYSFPSIQRIHAGRWDDVRFIKCRGRLAAVWVFWKSEILLRFNLHVERKEIKGSGTSLQRVIGSTICFFLRRALHWETGRTHTEHSRHNRFPLLFAVALRS